MPPANIFLQVGSSPDPLPRYTPDAETISIRSCAPSYISEVHPDSFFPQDNKIALISEFKAPSYHSNPPSQAPPLPRSHATPPISARASLPHHVPGFHRPGSVSSMHRHSYNIAEWSPATNGPRARHYQAVANRRATMAREPNSLMQTLCRIDNIAASLNQRVLRQQPITETEPQRASNVGSGLAVSYASPLEDPSLVGDEAASRATARRLYLEQCAKEEALKEEQKGWDFMFAQLDDRGGRVRGFERNERRYPR